MRVNVNDGINAILGGGQYQLGRQEVILSLEPRVTFYARSFFRKLPARIHLSLEDLTSYGWIGAIQAVDRFDPARKVKLTSFACQRISGAILDGIRAMDPGKNRSGRPLLEVTFTTLEGGVL